MNLDGKVDYDDNYAFSEYFANHDRRADVNGNGRFDPEPPIVGENEIQQPVWPGSDAQIFWAEYARTQAAALASGVPGGVFYGDGALRAIEHGSAADHARAIPVLSQDDDLPGQPGVHNRFGYRGYWFEPELGVYFVRHRVLDPRAGRWLTRDPIGYAGGWNLYRYVEGRPLGGYDPMGLDGMPHGFWYYVFHPFASPGTDPVPGIQRPFTPVELFRLANGIPLAVTLDGARAVSDRAVTPDQIADAQMLVTVAKGQAAVQQGGNAVSFAIQGQMVVISMAGSADDLILLGAAKLAAKGLQAVKFVGGKVIGTFKSGQTVQIVGDEAAAIIAIAKRRKAGVEINFKAFTTDNFRENLEIALGRKLTAEEHAHHLIAKADARAEASRDILAKYGIDVNDPRYNGVALPKDYHGGIHTGEYYEWIDRQLRRATNREDIVNTLNTVRNTLEKGERPWECLK